VGASQLCYYSGTMTDVNPLSDEESIRAQAQANAPAAPANTEITPDQREPEIAPEPAVTPPAATPAAPVAPTPVLTHFGSEKLATRLKRIKRMFFLTLIGCVGAAALVSVVAILLGDFGSTVWKTIWVIISMALHMFVILGYTSALFKQEDKTGKSPFTITNVALFSLLVASFIITILSIWDVMTADMTIRSYGAMLIVLVASIHSDVLYSLRNYSKALNAVIALNFVFIVLVAAMLVIAIIGAGEGWSLLGKDSFFWRLLGAAGVIDASLTVISAIMLKMWQQSHPELLAKSGGGTVSVGPIVVKSLIILIVLVFFWPVILVVFGILWFLIGAMASPFMLLG